MKDEQTIDYYLKLAWQSVANKYNHIAAQYELTQATGYVLINIRSEGTPVSQIAYLLGVKTTSLSRMLNNLQEAGLIYREVNAADKRSVKVFLTPLGVEKRKIAKQVVRDFNAHLRAHLTITEREVLVAVLERISRLALEYQPGSPTEENTVEEEFV